MFLKNVSPFYFTHSNHFRILIFLIICTVFMKIIVKKEIKYLFLLPIFNVHSSINKNSEE